MKMWWTDNIFAQNSGELEGNHTGRVRFGSKSVLKRNCVGECKIQIKMKTNVSEMYV